ncbi:hypothetical protein [Absidia glauca]|uniref:ATP-dependent DNA helicase n=1 Tax=Absidia glauca TaxID=4829 RepID=A0A168P754_ABSGL|nr:hypothetical protein [Absidia glauca]
MADTTVWQLKQKVWTARKRGFAIGRIPYCTPTCGERYYLRLLLVNVAGSKSFDDIKTVNGHQSETFKEACLQLHLIDDDREWTRCFEEASLFSSGGSLRNLFVTALTFGQLTDPVSLWAAFRDSICDDLDHKLNRLFPGNILYASTDDTTFYDGQPSYDYGLYLIETTLNELSKSLGDFNLLLFKHNWTAALNQSTGSGRTDNSLVDEQLAYDTQEEEAAYSSKYALFNLDQKHAFDRIVEKLQSHESASDLEQEKPSYTTFVYNTLCNYWRSRRKIVLCVASSGIASLLLSGGTTSHFRLKIPLKVNETSTCSITKNSKLAELLRMTTLLIWDEVPMQNKSCFETVDRTLRDIRSSNVLFGGLPVVLGGDFAQIPPVVRNGNRSSIVEASIKQSYIWGHTEVVQLKQNMRVRGTFANDLHFKEWLTSITYNTALQNAKILLPQYISQTYSIDELISKVYPQQDLIRAVNDTSLFYKSAILTPKNDTADALNQKVLDLMPGVPTTLISADKADFSDEEGAENEIYRPNTEYLQTLNPGNFPPSKLTLKVGCIVMLLRNLNPKKGLCNGTRLIVKEIGQYVLKVAVMKLNENSEDQVEFIPRIQLTTMEDDYPFILSRKQFPLKLSFAMTINKSQGQSLTNVGIDLRSHLFTHGQLYVALSRSTNLQGIHVLHGQNLENITIPPENNTIENIIYPELLI